LGGPVNAKFGRRLAALLGANVVDYLVSAARGADGSLLSASTVTLRRLLLGYFIGLCHRTPARAPDCILKFAEDTVWRARASAYKHCRAVCLGPSGGVALFGPQTEGAMLFVCIMGTVWSVVIATDTACARSHRSCRAPHNGLGPTPSLTDVILPASLPYLISRNEAGLGVCWRSLMAAEIYVTILTGFGSAIAAFMAAN